MTAVSLIRSVRSSSINSSSVLLSMGFSQLASIENRHFVMEKCKQTNLSRNNVAKTILPVVIWSFALYTNARSELRE
jgi:hypothetical protein